ncbi:pyridoxal 5'-phosphate synthase lyase subunit PdxS [Thermoplasma sp. Kam2015]|uniref:pyridoxal 5'-phosphate synthase lyase subunit PdxS n=1 Tax=Thermoplasma sp. Kam2015 TaxID=2094122 RepID=UPI000D9B7659|nr:pyridoxal 5'-phosphate synthase lyase subunit PdxS [Thermoplasma sp. Kam2015]PYB68756.1 pyridoxal 5'-phosphate synthase lyase subunit PdxS [Thermoplasma sp. Kam2015]
MTLDLTKLRFGSELIKRGFSAMTKGGVIMDVTTAEQAKIAEAAGAVAVMALERVPADIRAAGGVARMADPLKIKEIMDAVSIPVMAKVRIGHISEAYVLEKIGVDMLDESEVLTPADPFFHLYKKSLTVPVVAGARNLPEAVRRIFEGAAMIRTKGEAGTGNIIEAVRHIRKVNEEISILKKMTDEDLRSVASNISSSYFTLRDEASKDLMGSEGKLPYDSVYAGLSRSRIEREILGILRQIRRLGRLPVVNFAAGGVATPADGALMMELGADGVFVGSGIFKSPNPEKMARSIVEAVENYRDYEAVEKASEGLQGMPGVDIESIPKDMRLQERGW